MLDRAIFSSGQHWRAISDGRVLMVIDVADRDQIRVRYEDAEGTFVLGVDELVFDYEPVVA